MRRLKRIMPEGSMRKFTLLVTGSSLLGILLFVFVFYSETGIVPGLAQHARSYLSVAVIMTAFGIVALKTDELLNRLIKWKSNFLLRFVSGLLANALVAILVFSFSGLFIFSGQGDSVLKMTLLSTFAVFVYETFYGLFYSYHYYAVVQAEQLQSDRWQLELQFESLKNQIGPHYLFNCLNTVSSLLYKDTHTAEEFIRRMADTFRYVLSHQKQKLVTLRDELEFVKSYYFLLQVRFEYQLMLDINLPAGLLDSWIPPMTLQLLMENAVKHNNIDKDHPLMVYIAARDNTHLLIHNTKTAPAPGVSGFRVGLENIRRRYHYFTDAEVLVKDLDKFIVELPVLKNPHTPTAA